MKNLLIYFNVLLILLFILISSFFLVHYDRGEQGVYGKRMGELNTTERAQMKAIYNSIDYKDVDLSFLTFDEQSHMKDVRRVFNVLKVIFLIILLTIITELSILILRRGRDNYDILRRSLLYGGVATLLVALLLTLSSFFDFSSFWTEFHHILFPQGNWMFPANSVLITLFPEQFFSGFATQVLFATGAFALIAIGAAASTCTKQN